MRKAITYLLILIVGITIGIVVNTYLTSEASDPVDISTNNPVNFLPKQRIEEDTVSPNETTPQPLAIVKDKKADTFKGSTINIDTLEENNFEPPFSDSTADTTQLILQEKKIGFQWAELPLNPVDSSDVEALLNVKKQSFSNKILVEFWNSPLNLIGYQLSRNKLKLYGFNPNETITLAYGKKEDELILQTQSVKVNLIKTNQFQSLTIK